MNRLHCSFCGCDSLHYIKENRLECHSCKEHFEIKSYLQVDIPDEPESFPVERIFYQEVKIGEWNLLLEENMAFTLVEMLRPLSYQNRDRKEQEERNRGIDRSNMDMNRRKRPTFALVHELEERVDVLELFIIMLTNRVRMKWPTKRDVKNALKSTIKPLYSKLMGD